MKSIIPYKRQEDILHMFWMLTGALESRCDKAFGEGIALDKCLVVAAYNQLNELGYTKERPAWERRAAGGNPSLTPH